MSETPSSPDPQQDPQDPTPDPHDAPTTQGPAPEPEPAPAAAAAPRRLLRSRDDRVLGGVCGGLARYFNVDPLIVRIAAVALIFLGGISVVAYIAALLLVPEDDGTGHPTPGKPGRLATIAGVVVIVLGAAVLLDGHWGFGFGWFFGGLAPALLIVTILAIAGQRLLAGRGENQPTAARIAGAALMISGIGLGVLLLAAGGAVATAVGGGAVIAAVVILLGVVMVAFSFRDRRARWLALPALALAVPSSVVAAAGVDVDHGIGSRDYAPASADVVRDNYELGVGEMVVDLRDTRWDRGATINLTTKVGTGHLLVLVPQDTCVQADTHAGLGYVNVLGHDSGGADVDDQEGSVARAPAQSRRLVLDGEVGIGAVEVRHHRDGWERHNGPAPDAISKPLADAGCGGARG
jgi:phage shock protein PspC (stress-responsive transcriptional regulator)